MKVYISADLEGATGVSSSVHMKDGGYERMRQLLTDDINAAIEGAYMGGATEVLVADGHGNGTNILIEQLDERAELISGSNAHLCQMVGIDGSYDAVFFIGYHGHEGHADGVLNHTVVGSVIGEVKCNGKVVGETGLNAATAGYHGVPVALVVGDDVVCEEARSLLGDVETVAVKKAIDRYTARLLPPRRSHALIRQAAQRALERVGELRPYDVGQSVEIEVTTRLTSQAHMCALFPTIERRGPKVIAITSNDYLEAFKQLWGCIIIGIGTRTEI